MASETKAPTMLAALARANAQQLALEAVPRPIPAQGEVLIKVAAAGIAPGMMKLLERGQFKHLPTIPGHEMAGTVTLLGAGVDEHWLHARVRVHPMLTCGHCAYCLTGRPHLCAEAAMMGHAALGHGNLPRYRCYHKGGLAEYVRAPVDLLDRLPEHVSFEVGAKLHDLANAVRALKCAALPPRGRLIITAATGTMGTASILLAKFYGAQSLTLVARSRKRLEDVLPLVGNLPVHIVPLDTLGPDWETTGALTEQLRAQFPDGADGVLDFFPSGAGSVQAMAALGTGGTFVHMGANNAALPLSLREMMLHCWRLVGTKACTRADTNEVLALLDEKKINADVLITHRFALQDVNQALQLMLSRREPMWMATVHP